MSTEQELKLNEDLARGVQAERVLTNPIYQEAFVAARAKYFNQFSRSKLGDEDERNDAWRMMRAIDDVEGHLLRVMQTGDMAEKTLAHKVKSTVRKIARMR